MARLPNPVGGNAKSEDNAHHHHQNNNLGGREWRLMMIIFLAMTLHDDDTPNLNSKQNITQNISLVESFLFSYDLVVARGPTARSKNKLYEELLKASTLVRILKSQLLLIRRCPHQW